MWRKAAGEPVPDCAAKSLIENMIDKSETPDYTERVVRYALGSMYSGKLSIIIRLCF